MPRFVLLRHECPPSFKKTSHWDFMLESGGVLRTWELQELPESWSAAIGETSCKINVAAIPLSDHRLTYLDFEGPLSDDRGNVRCCDRGAYELLESDAEMLVFNLAGDILQGTAILQRVGSTWQLQPTS